VSEIFYILKYGSVTCFNFVNRATFLYSHNNEVSLIGSLIVGPKGGRIIEVSLETTLHSGNLIKTGKAQLVIFIVISPEESSECC